MTNPTNIFHLWQSMDDYNETQIYGKLNAGINWGIFIEVAEGKAEYIPLEIKMRTDKILTRDLIGCPGCCGLISKKALEIIELASFRDFIMFPLTVNNASYFALYATKSLDCLDIENSIYTKLNIGNVEWGYFEISKHAFYLDKIKPSTAFKLPQTEYQLYCTEDIGRRILENNLCMMAQPLLYEEPDLRTNRVQYNNPFLGISFEEPLNYRLACKQYKKMQQGKKLSDKAWENKMPTPQKDEYILEMKYFELLKSDTWLQKVEIYIHLTAREPETIFNENRAVTKLHNIRPDFDCRTNENHWATTCIKPFKNKFSFVVIIIHREDEEKYFENAIEIFRNMTFS